MKLTACVQHVLALFLSSIQSFSLHSNDVQNSITSSGLVSKYISEHPVLRQPQTKFSHCIIKNLAVDYCQGVQGLAFGTDSVDLRRRLNTNFGNFILVEKLNYEVGQMKTLNIFYLIIY